MMQTSKECCAPGKFEEALFHYAFGYVQFKLGQEDAARTNIRKADEIYVRTGPRFYWAGWGTSFLKYLSDNIAKDMDMNTAITRNVPQAF
jgi:hypothetical protein